MLISVWQEGISVGRKTAFESLQQSLQQWNLIYFQIFKQKAKITNKRTNEIEVFTYPYGVLHAMANRLMDHLAKEHDRC